MDRTKKVKEVIQDCKERMEYWWKEGRHEPDFDWDSPQVMVPAKFRTQLWWLVTQLYGVIVCAIVGHKYVDHSYCGPDSGHEDISCARCGWSFYHIYY